MKLTRALSLVACLMVLSFAYAATASGQKPGNQAVTDGGWPRKFSIGASAFAIYQPHVQEWVANRFSARAAFSVTSGLADPCFRGRR